MKFHTLLLAAGLMLPLAPLNAADNPLTEEVVRNVILGWFATTNEHRPTAELLAFADENIEFRYPNLLFCSRRKWKNG